VPYIAVIPCSGFEFNKSLPELYTVRTLAVYSYGAVNLDLMTMEIKAVSGLGGGSEEVCETEVEWFTVF
jgi:hypothetical protein